MATGLWWVPGTGTSAGERLVIRTPRGFVIQSPETNDFRFLCNEAVGIQDGEDASFAELNGNGLLISTYANGVVRGSEDACTWSPITDAMTTPAFDVIASGADPTAYVVGGAPHQGDHFFAGRSAGTVWSTLANSDFPYTRVRAARSNPARIYLTGISLDDTGAEVHRLGVSDDAGKTVVDRIIALGPQDLQARVLDVDPLHPDHLYVYVESNSAEVPERLLVSADGGQSYTTGPTLHDLQGFAQSDDGTRVWVGGKEGLYRSVDGGGSFAPLGDDGLTSITSLAFHAGRLYAGGVLNSQLVVAVSEDDGDSFRKLLSFDLIREAVNCPALDPAHSPANRCSDSLAHWRWELGTLDPPTSNIGAGGSGGPPPVAKSSGCAVGGGGQGPPGASDVALLLLAVASVISPPPLGGRHRRRN